MLEQLIEQIRKSGYFDEDWYLSQYRDVSLIGIDPVYHYLWLGRRLGRKPSPDAVPGVDLASVLGLQCDQYGFDPTIFVRRPVQFTLAQSASSDKRAAIFEPMDKRKIDIAHKLAFESNDPCRLIFDADWYLTHFDDVRSSELDPWSHYLRIGKAEQRQPNAFFVPKWYLEKNPDVAAASLDPVDHYVRFGFSEGRPVGPSFDANFYRMQLPAPLPPQQDPLAHYLSQPACAAFLTHPNQIDSDIVHDRLGTSETLEPTKITIGIVAYKQEPHEINSLLQSALAALKMCGDVISADLLVFDNGATLSQTDLLDGVRLYNNRRNEGFGRSQNYLMEIAFDEGAKYYVGANPDGAFHPDCVLNLLKMAQRHHGKALIEAVQFPEEHPKFYHPMELKTEWCSGACFLIPVEVWTETRGFDRNIFLYCEDVDLSWMARYRGFETLTCSSALFYHDVSGRGYSPFVWKEMLIAGRYIGHKWNSRQFVDFAEQRLIDEGFFTSRADLPPIPDVEQIADAHGIADFSRMFSFSTTRW